MGARGRPRQHDRPRPLLRHADQHLAAPAGPGRGRRARGAAPRRGDDARRCGTSGPRSTSAGRCRSRATATGLEEIEAGLARGAGRSAPAASSPSISASRPRPTPARAGTTRPGDASPRRSRRWLGATDRAFAADLLPPPGRPVVAPGGRSSCRGRGGPLPGPGDRTRAGIALPGAARRDQPRPAVGRAGRARSRRTTCSPRSTAGSPRASTRRISRTPRRCSTS